MQQEGDDLELKILVFTKFFLTRVMIRVFLPDRGFAVACLNGPMDIHERMRAHEEFSGRCRKFVSTDAGGKGLNLQPCREVVNYGISWNPMRIKQRIDMVDRIGQTHTVRTINLLFVETVEFRVREVLEEELAAILRDVGVDKAGDVLDLTQGGQFFAVLYGDAILHPDVRVLTVENTIDHTREQSQTSKRSMSIPGSDNDLSPDKAQRMMPCPLSHWVKYMTAVCLQSADGSAVRRGIVWDLVWPDCQIASNVVFTINNLKDAPTARLLTLYASQVRGLAMRAPCLAPRQPVLRLAVSDLPAEPSEYWSLWQIRNHNGINNRWRVRSLLLYFFHRCPILVAPHVWGQLLTVSAIIQSHIVGEPAKHDLAVASDAAEIQGRSIYDEVLRVHHDWSSRERSKYALTTCRRAIERIDLSVMLAHRLAQIEEEECNWRNRLQSKTQITSETTPLIIVYFRKGAPGG